jgi:hypothetical protein
MVSDAGLIFMLDTNNQIIERLQIILDTIIQILEDLQFIFQAITSYFIFSM